MNILLEWTECVLTFSASASLYGWLGVCVCVCVPSLDASSFQRIRTRRIQLFECVCFQNTTLHRIYICTTTHAHRDLIHSQAPESVRLEQASVRCPNISILLTYAGKLRTWKSWNMRLLLLTHLTHPHATTGWTRSGERRRRSRWEKQFMQRKCI